jgi:hypothetical protein
MADVLTKPDETKTAIGVGNLAGFNLVDLSGSHSPQLEVKQPSSTVSVADLGMPTPIHPRINLPPSDSNMDPLASSYALKDPLVWRTRTLHDIYENGVVKLFSDDGGKRQFGVKVSDDNRNRAAVIPIGKAPGGKHVSLEFRLKF